MRAGGGNINTIRYADDTVLVADTAEKLHELVIALHRACESRGLGINVGPGKTEVLGLTKRNQDLSVNIMLGGKQIPQMERYEYLGCMITENGRNEKEVVIRIEMAKATFNKMKKVLSNLNMNMTIRLRLLKYFVRSVLLHGSEVWTLYKKLKKRIEAVETWLLRRMHSSAVPL